MPAACTGKGSVTPFQFIKQTMEKAKPRAPNQRERNVSNLLLETRPLSTNKRKMTQRPPKRVPQKLLGNAGGHAPRLNKHDPGGLVINQINHKQEEKIFVQERGREEGKRKTIDFKKTSSNVTEGERRNDTRSSQGNPSPLSSAKKGIKLKHRETDEELAENSVASLDESNEYSPLKRMIDTVEGSGNIP